MFKGMEKVWDIVGEILAVVMVLVYALLIVNAKFGFIPEGTFLNILEILRTYGSLLDGFWAFLRLLRAFFNAAMLAVIVGNALQEMAGVKTELLFSNVVAFVVTVALNWLVIRADQRRFYDRCDRALAKKIIRAERQMAYSIITRLTLIFTIGTIATLFVVTDTSDYYLGKDGRIYRVKDTMSL